MKSQYRFFAQGVATLVDPELKMRLEVFEEFCIALRSALIQLRMQHLYPAIQSLVIDRVYNGFRLIKVGDDRILNKDELKEVRR